MQTSAVTAATAANSDSTSSVIEQALGKDAFLQLLITQIRYQDPLEPMDDREFIAQLAQFSTLEQMQQMNSALSASELMWAGTQALTLVGRQITAQEPGAANQITGTVEAVSFSNGIPVLLVGGQEVQLSWVMEVR